VQIIKDGDLYKGSYITGPTHNFLGLQLAEGDAPDDFEVIVLPARGGCTHGSELTPDVVQPWINAGIERANQSLGTTYHPVRAEIVANDTHSRGAYEILAMRIVCAAYQDAIGDERNDVP